MRQLAARSTYLDNARAILIVLIVAGHVMKLRLGLFAPLYLLIYAFHMPAFAFVSGYLSKPDTFSPKGRRALARLAGAYVVFQAIYVVWAGVFRSPIPLRAVLLYPYWLLWWLVSLACWRMLLPAFAPAASTLRRTAASLALAVAAAVAIGFVVPDGRVLSISRTIVFLPFFLAGYFARARNWRVRATPTLRIAAVAIFVAAFAVVSFKTLGINEEWLWARFSFAEMDALRWTSAVRRLGLLALSATLVAAFLALVPSRPMRWFTAVGAATLPIYLWHGLAIRSMDWNGWEDVFAGSFLRVALTTLALVALLSLPWIARATDVLIAPWEHMKQRRRSAMAEGDAVIEPVRESA